MFFHGKKKKVRLLAKKWWGKPYNNTQSKFKTGFCLTSLSLSNCVENSSYKSDYSIFSFASFSTDTFFAKKKKNRIFPRINYLWWKQVRPTYNYQGCKPNFLKGNQQSTKLCRQRVYFTHWGKMQCKCQHWVFVINMEQIIYVINSLCLLCKGYLIGPE